MIIYSVKLFNFMGFHGEHYRKFYDKAVIGIIGEYKGNAEHSNQSGKTTIIEAITYALFGLSRAAKELELIHYGEDMMWVEVVLINDDGKKFTIKRGRDVKNNGILEVDFQDKKTEGQESICKLLGFDKKEFQLTTFFKQSDINQFMDLGSSEQKNHIIKWFNIEHWSKLEKATKEDLSGLNTELKTLKIKHDQLKETFDNDVDLEIEKKALELQLTESQEALQKRRDKLKKLDEQDAMSPADLKRNKVELGRLKDKQSELYNKKEAIEKTQGLIDKAKGRILELNSENAKLEVKSHDMQSIVKKKTELAGERKLLQAKMKAYENKTGGICPIINESCDRINFTKADYQKFEADLTANTDGVNKCDRLIDRLNTIQENNETLKDTQDNISIWQEKLKNSGKLDSEITEVKAEIKKIVDAIESYNPELDSQKAEVRGKIDYFSDKVNDLNKEIGRVEQKIESEAKNKAEVKSLAKQLKLIGLKAADLNYLAMMFGKNGIPSQEIENGFQEVEDDANHILGAMQTGMEIIFRPTRELDAKEPSCLVCNHIYEKGFRGGNCPECQEPRRNKTKDELNFQVTTADNAYSFHMDSGGGKSLLATAIRMALTQLKRRMGKCNLNVVFLDEPDSSLDNHNAKSFIKLITHVLTKEMGIQQVFWVSHNKDIQGSVPHVLKVIKHDGKATTKWA